MWEDAKHVLAWYNGAAGNVDDTAGLYCYDVTTQQLSLVLPFHALGVATLASPQKEVLLLLSMRYSHGQLFYQAIVHPFEQESQSVIYRYPMLSWEPDSQIVVATEYHPHGASLSNPMT